MYTKEELESMDIPQLMGIAEQLGVKVSPEDDLETVVYAILDKAAEDSAANSSSAPKRKRTRIIKKDTNKVYTVNGTEGENFDLKKNQGKPVEPTKQASLFNELPASNDADTDTPEDTTEQENTPAANDNTTTEVAPQAPIDPLAAFPKHRGRR